MPKSWIRLIGQKSAPNKILEANWHHEGTVRPEADRVPYPTSNLISILSGLRPENSLAGQRCHSERPELSVLRRFTSSGG